MRAVLDQPTPGPSNGADPVGVQMAGLVAMLNFVETAAFQEIPYVAMAFKPVEGVDLCLIVMVYECLDGIDRGMDGAGAENRGQGAGRPPGQPPKW